MPSKIRSFSISALLLSFATPLCAQPPAPGDLSGFDLRRVSDPGYDFNALADVLNTQTKAFILYLRTKEPHLTAAKDSAFRATFATALKAVENGRVDEQAGAGASLGAAASAAEKAGITGLITAAMESGAMTQTLDQNIFTLRGNAEGLFRFLTGQDVIPICNSPDDTGCDPSPFNNLELTASFDVSKTSTSETVTGQNPLDGAQITALLTSSKRQFASASARYVIVNNRDLRSTKYRTAWKSWYDTNKSRIGLSADDLLLALREITRTVQNTDAHNPDGSLVTVSIPGRPPATLSIYDNWLRNARVALNAAPHTETGVRTELIKQMDLLEAELRKAVPDLDARIEAANSAYTRFFNIAHEGFALGNMPMLTAIVTYTQPTSQPKLIESKFSFAWSPKSKGPTNPGTVTLNGGLSFYTKAQPSDTKGGTAIFRTADFAFQFDRPMSSNGAAALTLGGYVQYQASPSLIIIPPGTTAPGGVPLPGNATTLLAPKGTIAVAHASITLQIPNTGVKLPIGISWSNRTALVTGSEVRGHIGFSFDTHSILLTSK